MQMTQKRKCEYAHIKPLIAGVMWESDGRDACRAQGREKWGRGEGNSSIGTGKQVEGMG